MMFCTDHFRFDRSENSFTLILDVFFIHYFSAIAKTMMIFKRHIFCGNFFFVPAAEFNQFVETNHVPWCANMLVREASAVFAF